MYKSYVLHIKYMVVSCKGGTPNGWFMTENTIKMDDVGVPPLMETPICISNGCGLRITVDGAPQRVDNPPSTPFQACSCTQV